MEITGKVIYLDPKKDVSKKDTPFFIKTFGIKTEDEVNGTVYENFIGFQAVGDKCDKFENLNIGDKVKVLFAVKGTLKEDDKTEGTEKNPKSLVIFTNLSAYGVEVIEKAGVAKPSSQPANSDSSSSQPENSDDLPF